MGTNYIMMVLADGSSVIIPSEERHLIPSTVVTSIDLKFFPIIAATASEKRQGVING